MKANAIPSHSRRLILLVILLILAAGSMACNVPENVFRFFLGFRDEDPAFNEAYGATLIPDDLIVSDNSESVLEESDSYGSASEGSTAESAELPSVPDPVSQECGEAGICVAVYPVDIRSTANPPDVMVWANAAEYPSPACFSVTVSPEAGPWSEWMVLREPGQFIQAVSPAGYTALGMQFWGDDTNGWTAVSLDGVEVWRGDTTAFGSDGINYVVYVEISGVDPGSHTLRAEVLGQPGKAGGDNVPVFYFAYRK